MTEQEGELQKQIRQAVSAGGIDKAVTVVGQWISRAAGSSKDPRPAVVGVCRGGMGALLVAGQDLPEAAVKILESLPNLSLMMRVGPEELMSWVMEGIAEVTVIAPPEAADAIRTRIDERFMGAGEVFDSLCEKSRRKGPSA